MAQFNLQWDNTDILANVNNISQRLSYRRKDVGGSWLTVGFTPANDLLKTVVTATSPVVDNNAVYEFKLEGICTDGGPTLADNGIIENIGFACIEPLVENTNNTSQITVDLTGTNIVKVVFVLRLASTNALVHGPVTVDRIGSLASSVAGSLTPGTAYYWQAAYIAIVNGVEVNSSSIDFLNSLCGPYVANTDATLPPDLYWVALDTACETEGGFGVEKTISGLSSPAKIWHDSVNNLTYVADHDDPAGNVYWFNPDTATTAAHMTHTTAVQQSELYNTFIDSQYRRIYFVGANSGGLISYNIDTDIATVTPYGVNGPYSRITLTVTSDKIYCNNGNTGLVIIDRATLVVDSTILFSSITNPQHFSLDVRLIEGNGKMYVVNVANAAISSIGVYSPDFATHFTEIVLPGAAAWSGGASKFWQTGFYDAISNQLYIGDIGSSRRYVIDCNTDTVLSAIAMTNKSGKSNILSSWTINPITNELFYLYTALNNTVDATQVKRTYKQDRVTHMFTTMYEFQAYNELTLIAGTNRLLGVTPGTTFWTSNPSYNVDGTITVLSNSIGTFNTGIEVVNTLRELDANNSNLPTGNVKNNIFGDPDYIAPEEDLAACAITHSLDCPDDSVVSFYGTTLEFEISIINAVRDNPAIAKIQVLAYNTGTASVEGLPKEFVAPFSNYMTDKFVGLGGSSYDIQVRYLDSSNNVLTTC